MKKQDDAELPCEAPSTPINRWTKFWLRANSQPFIWLTIAVVLFFIWAFRNPNPSMVGISYAAFFLFGCLPIICLRKAQLDIKARLEKTLRLQPDQFRRGYPLRYSFLPLVAMGWLILYSQAPMACGFRLSRTSLDHWADEALANPEDLERFQGRWAGIYRISSVEVYGQTVVFCTGESAKGCWGFARVPSASGQEVYHIPELLNHPNLSKDNLRDFPPRDLLSRDIVGQRISGDWFVVYSNYWYYKFVHED